MFGRLPRLYRWRTVAVALLVCAALGAWLVSETPIPLVASVGALLGGAAGIAVAYSLLHDFHHKPQPVRVRHRR